MSSILIIGSLQLGLLYAIMAMGIYTTFRILNVPDLTVDGSFTLGMACGAVITVNGHPLLALFAAMAVGAGAGYVTGVLQTKVGIHPILSGILVMTGLYTVNLAVMGEKANISLVGSRTLFMKAEELISSSPGWGKTLLAFLVCMIIFLLLTVFYKTRLGLAIRATGDNEDMVRSSSINASFTKCVGLAVGNACVALSGALMSQYQMNSDVNFGIGMVVIGLASVIIGETFLGRRSITLGLLSAILGSVVYRMIVAYALSKNIFPPYALRLVSAVIVAVALSIPTVAVNIRQSRIRRGGK